MMKPTNSITARLTVCTVCADRETAAKVMDECARSSDMEFAGEFHEYISRNKRPQFSSRVRDSAGSVALIDFDLDATQASVTAELLQQIFPGKIAIIAISANNDSGLLLQAMRAGCNEFLTCPLDAAQYTETVGRLQARFA